jgi:hypothetical protein
MLPSKAKKSNFLDFFMALSGANSGSVAEGKGEGMMICRCCGAPLEEGALFCGACRVVVSGGQPKKLRVNRMAVAGFLLSFIPLFSLVCLPLCLQARRQCNQRKEDGVGLANAGVCICIAFNLMTLGFWVFVRLAAGGSD